MKYSDIVRYFKNLDLSTQELFLREIQTLSSSINHIEIIKLHGDALDDRRAECPHCDSFHYIKAGVDKKSRRYQCKDCMRTFTEFTGTWVAGI